MKLASKILSQVFDTLNMLQVGYCVMNKYEDLPGTIPTDVDIAIDNNTFNKLDFLLEKISSENNVKIVQKIWHGYYKRAYILSPLKIQEPFRLQLDFFVDFSARGYPKLITNEILLANRRKFKTFYIPDPIIELTFLVMRRIIKNDLRLSHIYTLQALTNKIDAQEIKQRLIEIFGEELGDLIIETIASQDHTIFQTKIDNYRKALKKWAQKNNNPIYLVKYGIAQLKRAINRLLNPVGLSVVLLGPDGSGKSTIAKLTLERVSGSFHGEKLLYWRPFLLPPIGRLKIWDAQEESQINPRPHDHPRQNRYKSLLRFIYYLFDYVIGYPIKVYWGKVKKKIIIFDRYYYDYLVDMQRYQFNIPKWLPKFFLPIIPSPDITIYLDAEPEELIRRKQELPLREVQRQIYEFRKIILTIPNSYSITTNKPVEDIVQYISFLILEKKSRQTKKVIKN